MNCILVTIKSLNTGPIFCQTWSNTLALGWTSCLPGLSPRGWWELAIILLKCLLWPLSDGAATSAPDRAPNKHQTHSWVCSPCRMHSMQYLYLYEGTRIPAFTCRTLCSFWIYYRIACPTHPPHAHTMREWSLSFKENNDLPVPSLQWASGQIQPTNGSTCPSSKHCRNSDLLQKLKMVFFHKVILKPLSGR